MKNDSQINTLNNIHSQSPKSSYETLKHNIKHSFFNLLYVLLKNKETNIWFEIFCILLQLLQLLAFPLHPKYSSIWKCGSSYELISNIFQYFQLITLFNNNPSMYYIAFYICVLLVIVIYLDVIIVAYSFSNNRLTCMFPLQLIQSFLWIIITSFYLPIMAMFLSVFSCIISDNGSNVYVESFKCYTVNFYVMSVIGGLFAVLFFGFALVFISTYIETKFTSGNPLAKSSTKADVYFMLLKTLSLIIFTFDNAVNSNNEWAIIIIMTFISGYVAYLYFERRPYYDSLISNCYKGTLLIFVWGYIVLFLGKVIEFSHYNGSLPLFFLGIPIIVIILIYDSDNVIAKLMTNLADIEYGYKALNQIKSFLFLIQFRNNSRKCKIEIRGYINQYEESCTFVDCALKKYLASLQKSNVDALIFLYQHAESMYLNAIAKFPTCACIRISYAFFLMLQMNKKRQCALELQNASNYSSKLEDQFLIFRYLKFLEEQSNEVNDGENNLDIVSNLAFKNHHSLFKSAIAKVSSLYIDFWSLLLIRNTDNYDDLTKLNDYGSKINTLVEEISNHFTKMQKLKLNDQDVLKEYSDFLSCILNDKDKALLYSSKINENEDTKDSFDDTNLISGDLNNLVSNNEYQYIICSAQLDKFGMITNISLGVCALFGYTKAELIGKNVEIIMPDIYHKGHKEILHEKLNEFKRKSVDSNELKSYKPSYREITTFGKNKSRYLIQLSFKTALIPTEVNDIIFIAKIWQEQSSGTIQSTQQSTFIITNNNFYIQSFTANAVSILGMNSSAINSNVEITDFIKQLYEEYLHYCISENEEKTVEQKLAIKKSLVSHRFKAPTLINWRRVDMSNESKWRITKDINQSSYNHPIHSLEQQNTESLSPTHQKSMNKLFVFAEDSFTLAVSEIIINTRQEGYLFKFEAVNLSNMTIRGRSSITNLISCSNKNIGGDLKKKGSSVITYNNPTNEKGSNIANIDKDNAISDEFLTSKSKGLLPIKIDHSFIPEINHILQFDPDAYSYKMNHSKPIDLRENLKTKALVKIQGNKPIKANKQESTSSSVDDDDNNDLDKSLTSDDDSNDSSNSSEHQQNNEIQPRSSLHSRKLNSSNGNDDQYYKVNMHPIKLSIYDFVKKMMIEIKNDKIDQVQSKLTEGHNNEESSPQLITNSPRRNNQKTSSDIGGSIEVKENDALIGKEISLIKQIEYALGKEESQPSIIKMKWICFIVFLIFIVFGSGTLVLVIQAFWTITENVQLIIKAYDLLVFNSLSIYYSRELILLHNENYTSFPTTREAYSEYIYNNTQGMFIGSNDLINYIITSTLKFSSKNNFRIFNSTLRSAIIEETPIEFTIIFSNLSYVSAFLETNTALFHLSHMAMKKIIPTNRDVFFYMYNSINEIALAYDNQGSVLLDELDYNIGMIKLFYSIALGITLAGLIGVYFLLACGYDGISKRKESYLEVFFEIGSTVIKASLDKCENFIKKITSIDNANDALSEIDVNEDNGVVIGRGDNDKNHKDIKDKKSSKKEYKSSREAQIIKGYFITILVMIGLFFALIFLFFNLYLGKVVIYMKFYQLKNQQDNEYMMLFNSLREFMFDSNSKVKNINSLDFLEDALNYFYQHKKEKNKYTEEHIGTIPSDYSSKHVDVYKTTACGDGSPMKSLGCAYFMANASNYGLEIALNYFVEEIRLVKNFAIEFKKNQSLLTEEVFNLTLTSTAKGDALWPSINDDVDRYNQYKTMDSINQFSMSDLHLNLTHVYLGIILPNFEYLGICLQENFNADISHSKIFNIILICVYLGLIILGYFCLWLPYEIRMNQTIYKTKNMLSIIPKEVLASLENINKLLNIKQNNIRNKMRDK